MITNVLPHFYWTVYFKPWSCWSKSCEDCRNKSPCCLRCWFCLFMPSISFWMEPFFLFINWMYSVACFKIWARDVYKTINLSQRELLFHSRQTFFNMHMQQMSTYGIKGSKIYFIIKEILTKNIIHNWLNMHIAQIKQQTGLPLSCLQNISGLFQGFQGPPSMFSRTLHSPAMFKYNDKWQ